MVVRMTLIGIGILALISCGGTHKHAEIAEEPVTHDPDPSASTDGDGGDPAASGGDQAGEAVKPSPCTGFDMDLMSVLIQKACEVPNPKPEDKPRDVKGILEVKAMAAGNKVPQGGHVDIVVTFTNKGANLLPLDFTIDPEPRFQIETYGAKNNRRVDLPPGNPPKVPADASRTTADPTTARVVLAANGKATVKLGWDAVKMRWAPEKLKGTPPEMGYPKAPAGNLPKGKYTLRIVTPLVGIFEGVDHEVSTPRAPIEVGN